jgi:hypothetical protein
MAFALTVEDLITVLQEPGCPICRQSIRVTQKYLGYFLWENSMDQEARQQLVDALGFCPQHTFQAVTQEMREYGDPLGSVVVYEQLNKAAVRQLEQWQKKQNIFTRAGNLFQPILQKIKNKPASLLASDRECPLCRSVFEHTDRSLAALFEEMGRKSADISQLYLLGDGLCLEHLNQGLSNFSHVYPQGAEVLVADAMDRLNRQQTLMAEYIRKHNWAYRDEKVTIEEDRAWRQTLGTFTGYAPDTFQPFNPHPE